jgi:hypothetical protein
MAPSGRKQKPAGQAVTRHPRAYGWLEVPDVPFTGGPKLPRRRCDGTAWPKGSAERWAAWSSMPHCRLWQPSDWRFALDTMEIASRAFEDGAKIGYSTEARYRERILGVTHDARQGMRIRYVTPADQPAPAGVTSLDLYRDL